jgi:8-amino-7-oxononanoate synthase
MPDFTSALYLGFTHPSGSLSPWRALTLGRPAALEEPTGGRALARELTQLIGGEAGMLYPSTLVASENSIRLTRSRRRIRT